MIGKKVLKRLGIFTMSMVLCASCMIQPAYAKNNYNNGNNGNNKNSQNSSYNMSYYYNIGNFLQNVGNILNNAGQVSNSGANDADNKENEIVYEKENESSSSSTSNTNTNSMTNQSSAESTSSSTNLEDSMSSDNTQSTLVTYENIDNLDVPVTNASDSENQSDSAKTVSTKITKTNQENESVPVDLSEVTTTVETDEDDTIYMEENVDSDMVLTGSESINDTVAVNETELLGESQNQFDNVKYIVFGIVMALGLVLAFYFIRKAKEGNNVILTDSMTVQKIATNTTDDKSVIEVKSAKVKDIKDKSTKQENKEFNKNLKKREFKEKKKQLKLNKVDNKTYDDFEIEVC